MKQISIKWKIFISLGVFTAIIIAILWLFQIVFLDDFYRVIKEREVKNAAKSISLNIENPELENIIANLSYQGELNISIYSSTGEHQVTYLGRKESGHINLMQLFIDAQKISQSKKGDDYVIVYDRPIKEPNGKPSPSERLENMTLVKFENDNFIVINSLLVPVNATVSTLQIQLFIITAGLTLIGLILSILLSRLIGKPIINLNRSAKILATGNYNVTFDGSGYKEIAELTETLNYATGELSKVDSLRKELIANISHDLRTPLTMISGYSEVMRDLPNENTQENIQIIIDEARRLTSLVNDVLDISKLESGNFKPVPTRFDITELLSSTVDRYKKLTDNNYEFIFDGNYYVDADEVQISQVFLNLINNAITHTGIDNKITVRQSLIYDNIGNNTLPYIKVEVIDTGDGVPEDKLNNIWDRYYKVDKTHKRAMTGSGLGLSIVKKIIDSHRGKYGVISNVNGSTFWFTLPQATKK